MRAEGFTGYCFGLGCRERETDREGIDTQLGQAQCGTGKKRCTTAGKVTIPYSLVPSVFREPGLSTFFVNLLDCIKGTNSITHFFSSVDKHAKLPNFWLATEAKKE